MKQTKLPLDYYTFKRIINNSITEADFLEQLCQVKLDDVVTQINSYHDILELIAFIFHDYKDIFITWVYDNNYGRENHISITYNNKEYNTTEEIYELLCKIFNKEILLDDIQIEGKE